MPAFAGANPSSASVTAHAAIPQPSMTSPPIPRPSLARPSPAIVTAGLLNLRVAPGGPVRSVLARGTTLRVLARDGGWLHVEPPGGVPGYVAAAYVRFVPPALPAARRSASTMPTGSPPAGPVPADPVPAAEPGLRFEGDAAIAPDGTAFGRKFRLGMYSRGATTLAAHLESGAARLPELSASVVRVLRAVSENEGRFEAVNTWDNAYLSFGICQWTAGAGAALGELPALLRRLQADAPEAFAACFGRYGLDVRVPTPAAGSLARGSFLLDGAPLAAPRDKERLRALKWAYRFWRAGHHDAVRDAQLRHAAARIPLFYRSQRLRVRGRPVADVVTSEYGVALLLDQHVNRPAHVPLTLVQAVATVADEVGVEHPERWGDGEERRVLEAYLRRRAETSMTDSALRAERIRRCVERGELSDRRGSFVG